MKKFTCAVLTAAMMFAMAGCGAGSGAGFGEETINVGMMGPLTGDNAIYGNAVRNGAEMAVNEINANGGVNGKQIAFVCMDDKGDSVEATNAYNKLSADGMDILVGAVTSQPTLAVAELAAGEGMPVITPTATMAAVTEGRPNVFRTCYTDPFQGEVLAKFIKEHDEIKTVAILTNNSSDYSTGVATAFREKCAEYGVEIVADENYADADNDMNAQLTTIMAANPDAIVVPDYYKKVALIADQARTKGYDKPLVGPDGFDGILGAIAADNMSITNNMFFANHYFSGSDDEIVVNFIKNYEEKYGETPNAFAASSYDAIYLMKASLESNGGDTSHEAFVSAIAGTTYAGVTGEISYKGNGDPVKSVYIIEIKDGAYTLCDVVEGE